MLDTALVPDAQQAAQAAQAAQAITVAVDPAKVILGAAALLGTLLVSAIGWIGAQIMKRIDGQGEKLDAHAEAQAEVASTVQRIDQELFGPNGQNGLRSDVRRITRQLDEHDRLLIRLAEREGVDTTRDTTRDRRTA